MRSNRSLDPEYQQAMLSVTAEQSAALNAHSKEVRARAKKAVEWSKRLRARCAALVVQVAEARRQDR